MNKREALIAMLNGERIHHVNDNKDPVYFFDGLNFIEEYKKSGREVFNIKFLENNGFKIYEPERDREIEKLVLDNEPELQFCIDANTRKINEIIDCLNELRRERES